MKRIRLSLQIAATYIGTIVGAGFASGKEIVQFFTQYGEWGTAGVILSCVLFTWLGTKVLLISHRIQAHSVNDLLRHLFGARIGTILHWMMFIMLLGTTSVMLAGAGAVFREQLGLSAMFGRLFTCVLCFILLLRGLKGLMWMNSIVVPILFLFIIALWMMTVPGAETITHHVQGSAGRPVIAFLQAIAYASFNLVSAFAVLAPLGSGIEDRETVRLGGIFGGLGFSFLLLLTHLILQLHVKLLMHDIPLAELVKIGLPYWFHLMFVVVIYGEIFSTFIGNLFGMLRQVEKGSAEPGIESAPSKKLILFFMMITLFISQIGYSALIQVLYPIYGYICLLILFYVSLRNEKKMISK